MAKVIEDMSRKNSGSYETLSPSLISANKHAGVKKRITISFYSLQNPANRFVDDMKSSSDLQLFHPRHLQECKTERCKFRQGCRADSAFTSLY